MLSCELNTPNSEKALTPARSRRSFPPGATVYDGFWDFQPGALDVVEVNYIWSFDLILLDYTVVTSGAFGPVRALVLIDFFN